MPKITPPKFCSHMKKLRSVSDNEHIDNWNLKTC